MVYLQSLFNYSKIFFSKLKLKSPRVQQVTVFLRSPEEGNINKNIGNT